MRGPRLRDGFTVVEVLVSLLLLAGLLQLTWTIADAQRRNLTAMGGRTAVLSAERAVWWALSTETAEGVPGRDWRVDAPGVLALRAFRGRGVACDPTVDPDGWVQVRYRGRRVPVPGKDSVLVLDDRGRWSARDLVERAGSADQCAPGDGESAERWRLAPPPQASLVLARVFERGSYHLEDRAFRYRRGSAGRQPLTAEVLDPAGTGIEWTGDGAILRFRGIPSRPDARAGQSDPGWARALPGG